jgi:ferric-dicitrate binding protein FerR (iron transport regulator)
MAERRSSGGRFDRAPRSARLGALGSIICLALLPVAAVRERGREAPIIINQRGTHRLPDGSYAGLSDGATVRYGRDFARRRVLWLHGKVDLEVVGGPVLTVWTETAIAKTAAASVVIESSGLDSTFVFVRRGAVRLRALNEDKDPAYPGVVVGAGQNGFAARMIGAFPRPSSSK